MEGLALFGRALARGNLGRPVDGECNRSAATHPGVLFDLDQFGIRRSMHVRGEPGWKVTRERALVSAASNSAEKGKLVHRLGIQFACGLREERPTRAGIASTCELNDYRRGRGRGNRPHRHAS
jgi:hypothetical protein